jgi:hypothetical protein
LNRLWPLLAALVISVAGCSDGGSSQQDDDEQMVGASKVKVGGPDAPKVEQAPPPSTSDPADD